MCLVSQLVLCGVCVCVVCATRLSRLCPSRLYVSLWRVCVCVCARCPLAHVSVCPVERVLRMDKLKAQKDWYSLIRGWLRERAQQGILN